MATDVSRIFSEILSSMALHRTLQNFIPRMMHTAVEVSNTICEGPPRESLPKTKRVAESNIISVMKGIALSHAEGLRGSRDDRISSIRVFCDFWDF